MTLVAPSPRIIEYCRQLSLSDCSSTKSLNLRHLGDLSASDLAYLPHETNSLWIGPGFRSPISEVLRNLPTGLQQLDLDLTGVAPIDGVPNNNIHDEQVLMPLLFERAMSLESLSLRAHGCASVRAVAQNLCKAKRLKTLDFRSNHMGDDGLDFLCRAMLTSTENNQGCPVQQLILSWNEITDFGVFSLCKALKHSRCQLKALDLSCNSGISDVGFKAICQALQINKSLERLTLFSCPRITNALTMKNLLVEQDDMDNVAAASGTLVCNYTLKYVDLGATRARAMTDVIEKIEFGLALNRAGRLQLRCREHDDFVWILQSNLQDDRMVHEARRGEAKPPVQWWRSAHDMVQREDPLQDLSISFHFLRQTSAFWSKLGGPVKGDPMNCD